MSIDAPISSGYYLTWNDSTRSKSVSRIRELDRLLLVSPAQRGLRRHVVGAVHTVGFLVQNAPTVVWYQFSFLLGIVLAGYSVIRKRERLELIADIHTKALKRSGWRIFAPIVRVLKSLALRSCSAVIVTNSDDASFALRQFGIRALPLPDPLPRVPKDTTAHDSLPIDVLFVCSFAKDEPLELIAKVAARLSPDANVVVTGDVAQLSPAALASLSRHARLPGFLSERDYWSQLRAARCIVVLTTEPACLPCGAYEAVALGKRPIVADDSRARAVFEGSARYVPLDAAALADAIRVVLAAPTPRATDAGYLERWQEWWLSVQRGIAERTRV